jgi:putative phosphoribosyl transferase
MWRPSTLPRRFHDRRDAGQQLAERLAPVRDEHPLVLGLTRGGVPVAAEVARGLKAPLDVIVVRKLGVPFHRELAFGALGENGVQYINAALVDRLGLTTEDIAEVTSVEADELKRRVSLYRASCPELDLAGRTVIIVDDGLATGATARVACDVACARGATRVILAVPVASPEALDQMASHADQVVSLLTPRNFSAVGEWYENFDQTDDAEVIELLRTQPGTS